MSTWTHCDGPDCNEQLDDAVANVAWAAPTWAAVELHGETLHFHKIACLAAWSEAKSTKPNVVPIREGV